jgi:predicted type IV restriction endonuclease
VDLIDKLAELANRVARQKDSVMTEEATKTAFVLPFLQALGYDVFNPMEVVPELTADHGVKKGEKVDYAIKRDGKIIVLIECKPVGAVLEAKYAGQLFRYFSVTETRLGVLTDGVRYVFFSDLDAANRMDDRPFFEFNLLAHAPSDVDELKRLSKPTFDLDSVIGRAGELKYHRLLLAEIKKEFDAPSDELIRMLTARVYNGRLTQQTKEQFTSIVGRALRDFLRVSVNERLKSALDTGGSGATAGTSSSEVEKATADAISPLRDDGIETTEDEIEGHRIIRSIGAEFVDPDRIVMRDAKSYCAILLDDNNRRPICRFHFGKTKLSLTLFGGEAETRVDLSKVSDIYKHRPALIAALKIHAGL